MTSKSKLPYHQLTNSYFFSVRLKREFSNLECEIAAIRSNEALGDQPELRYRDGVTRVDAFLKQGGDAASWTALSQYLLQAIPICYRWRSRGSEWRHEPRNAGGGETRLRNRTNSAVHCTWMLRTWGRRKVAHTHSVEWRVRTESPTGIASLVRSLSRESHKLKEETAKIDLGRWVFLRSALSTVCFSSNMSGPKIYTGLSPKE